MRWNGESKTVANFNCVRKLIGGSRDWDQLALWLAYKMKKLVAFPVVLAFVGYAQGLECYVCPQHHATSYDKPSEVKLHNKNWEKCTTMPCNNEDDFKKARNQFQSEMPTVVNNGVSTQGSSLVLDFANIAPRPSPEGAEYRCGLYDGQKVGNPFLVVQAIYQYCIGVDPANTEKLSGDVSCGAHKTDWKINEFPVLDDNCVCNSDNCNIPFDAKKGYRAGDDLHKEEGLKYQGSTKGELTVVKEGGKKTVTRGGHTFIYDANDKLIQEIKPEDDDSDSGSGSGGGAGGSSNSGGKGDGDGSDDKMTGDGTSRPTTGKPKNKTQGGKGGKGSGEGEGTGMNLASDFTLVALGMLCLLGFYSVFAQGPHA